MRHKEFELMLVEQEDLPEDASERLAAHLKDCSQCSRLKDRLMMVENTLRAVPPVPAPEGFAARFQIRLESARRRKRARMLLLTSLLMVLGVALGVGILAYALVSYGATILAWLLKAYNQVYWVGSVVDVLADTTIFFLESLIEQLPLLTWSAVSAAISILAITWLTSFYRLAYRTIRRE